MVSSLMIFCGALLGGLAVPLPDVDGAAKDWGLVRGKVVWAGGDIPKPQPVEMKDRPDKEYLLAKGPILSEEWVIHKENKGIANVYVWLAPEQPGQKLPIHPALREIKVKSVEMDQPHGRYVPHALAVREGQEVIASNSTPFAYCFGWNGHPAKNPGGRVALTAKSSHTLKDLKADEKFPIRVDCATRAWMTGWIRVFDHPYFAVTDQNGEFEIKQAPAGGCRLMVWHEAVGWRDGAAGRAGEKITIKAGTPTDLGNLSIKP